MKPHVTHWEPVSFVDEKPVAWLMAPQNGQCVVVTEKVKRVFETREDAMQGLKRKAMGLS